MITVRQLDSGATARVVSSARGSRVHALARPVPVSVTYGRHGTQWADTVCGQRIGGNAYSDDHPYRPDVDCQRCVATLVRQGPPLGANDTEVHATFTERDARRRPTRAVLTTS